MAKNLEELRAENPELAAQLVAEARAAVMSEGVTAPSSADGVDPVQAERQRIREIDALAGLFDAETINAAKYGEHPCTAEQMAYRAAQEASQQGRKFLAALEADTGASGVQGVGAVNGAGVDGMEDTPQAMAAQAKADAKAYNDRKKEVR